MTAKKVNLGRETERIEFKKSTSELREGVISVCAMLNKHGEGWGDLSRVSGDHTQDTTTSKTTAKLPQIKTPTPPQRK